MKKAVARLRQQLADATVQQILGPNSECREILCVLQVAGGMMGAPPGHKQHEYWASQHSQWLHDCIVQGDPRPFQRIAKILNLINEGWSVMPGRTILSNDPDQYLIFDKSGDVTIDPRFIGRPKRVITPQDIGYGQKGKRGRGKSHADAEPRVIIAAYGLLQKALQEGRLSSREQLTEKLNSRRKLIGDRHLSDLLKLHQIDKLFPVTKKKTGRTPGSKNTVSAGRKHRS